MKYIEYVNALVRKKIEEHDNMVLYGQNINAGSCLGGLCKGLKAKENGMVINSTNSENTLCGVGFGLMLNNVASIFFMKQQDFLLLGMDQLVNTYNFIRRLKPKASYTIMNIIVDSGYEGPQSRLNNFGDFCSMANVPGYTITSKADADEIIGKHLIEPGFRIIGVSQRLFKTDILEIGKLYSNEDSSLFQYSDGNDATIACFNLSLPNGFELYNVLKENGLNASLFSVNSPLPINWGRIIESADKTKKLVVIDDSKSRNLSCHSLLSEALEKCKLEKSILITRGKTKDMLNPNPDKLEIDYGKIAGRLVN